MLTAIAAPGTCNLAILCCIHEDAAEYVIEVMSTADRSVLASKRRRVQPSTRRITSSASISAAVAVVVLSSGQD